MPAIRIRKLSPANAEKAEIVREGIAALAEYVKAKERLDLAKQRAIACASERRRNQSSVTLASLLGGTARVTWSIETRLDGEVVTAVLESVRKGVADAYLAEVFKIAPTYRMRKGWQNFMKTDHPTEIQVVKPQLTQAIQVREKQPSVQFSEEEET